MAIVQCRVLKRTDSVTQTRTISFASNVTAGNAVILISLSQSAGTDATVTDTTGSNTYTKHVSNPITNRVGLWSCHNVTGGFTDITIDWDGTTTNDPTLIAIERDDLDGFDVQANNDEGAASTTFTSGSTATTAQANEWAVGACYNTTDTSLTYQYDSPWTPMSDYDAYLSSGECISGVTSASRIQLCERTLSSTGAYAYTGTADGPTGVRTRSVIGIFKLAASTPSLSSATATNITATTATPRVTITFP